MNYSRTSKVQNLKSKPEEFLNCYDTGHNWNVFGYFSGSSSRELKRRLKCSSCGTFRDDSFRRSSSTWVLSSRTYSYPDDYLKEGRGRVTKADIHQESIRRVLASAAVLPSEDFIQQGS